MIGARRHLKPKLARMDRYNGGGLVEGHVVHVVDQLHQLQLDNEREIRECFRLQDETQRINRDLFVRFRFPFPFP